ncbi:N-acylneuraminate cytidylyltransferase [Rivularia sp. IAM M-261]|nr:N-acylneuraminate cytidylyltransferase [Rivularia sp. IAM M-261]
MIGRVNVIAIIPARGGSKGVPRKNIRILGDKPLIAHSILDAKEANLIDKVYVSTDNLEIAEISQKYGAEIIYRPDEIADDTASSETALIHALSEIEKSAIFPDLIVFLQCTSPIRSGQDIDDAIDKLQAENADSLLSVTLSHRFLWEEVNGIAKSVNYDYRNRLRRQDMKPQYLENGSIYIFKPWVIKYLGNRLGGKICLFPMMEAASWDIDSVLDFKVAEYLIKEQVTSNVY